MPPGSAASMLPDEMLPSEGFILPETLVLAGAICAGGAILWPAIQPVMCACTRDACTRDGSPFEDDEAADLLIGVGDTEEGWRIRRCMHGETRPRVGWPGD